MLPIAITTGEPSGIGAEVSVKAAWKSAYPVTLVGDKAFLLKTAQDLGLSAPPANVGFEDISLSVEPQPGVLDVRNSGYVLRTLTRAHELAISREAGAIVTAPVQKSVLCDAGEFFSGHTEFFQHLSGVKRVVMMLTSSPRSDALRVSLATTHLPLRDVADAITGELIDEVLEILVHALDMDFGISEPTVAVAGLNPHAGESGHMGREEIDVIEPALERARKAFPSADIVGPLPADTMFVPDKMKKWDAALCMYHDQGLPVLKHVGFAEGVNVTLGLPYIRTSVDHGTALDIAGRGIADARSMTAALELAHTLRNNRDARMA